MKIKYVLPEDIYIKIGHNQYLVLPKGFAWNGDSFVSDLCSATSCCHDLLYSKQPYFTVFIGGNVLKITVTRKWADLLYKKFLKLHYPLISKVRYYGLRLLGWMFYHKSEPQIIDIEKLKHLPLQLCSHGVEAYTMKNGILVKDVFKYYKLK